MITEGTDEEGLSPEASLQLIPAPPLSILNDTDKKSYFQVTFGCCTESLFKVTLCQMRPAGPPRCVHFTQTASVFIILFERKNEGQNAFLLSR